MTAYDQPALGGVYKLGAIQNESGEWERKLKLSEQAIKTSTPGILQVRRFFNSKGAIADMIYDELNPQPVSDIVVDPLDPTRRRLLSRDLRAEDLLIPVVSIRESCKRRRIAARDARARPAATVAVPYQYPPTYGPTSISRGA